jgi:VCBS repeat-containing protein
MSSVVAIVKSIVGQVVAVSPEGIRRVLIEGDRLLAGEQVLTGPEGAVTLQLPDGRQLDMGRDSQWSSEAPTSTTNLAEATAQAAPSVAELQQAIAAGADPTKDLEATAAGQTTGSTDGGNAGGGHSVVMLTETADVVNPNIGFNTAGLGNNATAATLQDDGVPQRASTLSLSATSTLTEAGGALVYTASVTQAPLSDLTITLSNGSTIVIAAGQTSGTVTVQLPDGNTPYLDAHDVTTTITGTTGGSGLVLTTNPAPAVTNITDTVDTTTVSLTAGAATSAEGTSITYTATLTNPAQTPVTVTLSDGSTITIRAGESSGSVVVPVQANDVYNTNATVSTTITGATGGNFENLATNPAPAVVQITDTPDTTTVSLTAGAATSAEGTSITYTATLTNPAQTPVTVTLSDGSTITIKAGESTGSVVVPVQANDVYNTNATVSTTITGATGGNFENLATNPTPAVVQITDTPDTTTLSLTAGAATSAEGTSITYTATLTNPAQTPVTVTLSDGTTITIRAGESTGSVVVPVQANDVYNTNATVSTTITGATGGNFENLATNPTPAVVQITDTPDTTTLSLTAGAATSAEGTSITYTATLTNPAQTPVTVTLSDGSTITIKAGESTGSVVVPVQANDVYNTNATVSTTITGATGGNFENLATDTTPAVVQITDTPDTTTVSLTAGAATSAEGTSITYTATLTNPAQTPVTVTLSDGSTITIKAGESTGSVVVPVQANDVYNTNATVSTTITGATGGNFENLATNPAPAVVQITDTPDTTTVSLTAGAATSAEGTSITYTATLTNPAQTPVTVTLSDGSTITIKAGESTGSVVVPVQANDVYNTNATVSTTITGATGGNFENLATNPAPAVVQITDTPDTTTVSLTAGAATSAEGTSITYTATLTNPAQTPVTVTLSDGSTITIRAGESTGSVVVPVQANDVYNTNATVSTTITGATGGNFENLATNPTPAVVQITDTPDTTTVSLTAGAATSAEGTSITYTATLTNPAQTPVTVTLSDGSTITIKAGESTGSVVVPVQANDVYNTNATVSTTITGATGGNFENLATDTTPAVVQITDTPDTTTVSLTAGAATSAEGTSITYTATLTNPAQTPVTVTLSDGSTITIKAGESTGSVVVPVQANDVYNTNATVSTTITGATGGNFENLATNPAPAVVQITDTPDTTTVSLTAGAATSAEGTSITYTATLTNPAQTPVTVTLSDGSTITIKAGESTGSVVVPVQANDVYNTNATVSTTITGATGGNFENLATDTTPAVVQITDTIDTTVASITGSTEVTEGQAATYTISLSNPAQTEVTINLTYSGTAADGSDYTKVVSVKIPANASSVTFDLATINDTIPEGVENVTVAIGTITGGNFENIVASTTNGSVTTTIIDNDALPVVDLNGDTNGVNSEVTFTEGNNAGVPIAADIKVSDVDSPNLQGAKVTLTNAQDSDTLVVGSPNANIDVATTTVNGQIVLTLTGTATAAEYETVIKSITFHNGSNDPSVVDRNITVTVNDGQNDSVAVTSTVHVAAVNDAPTITFTGGAYNENAAATPLVQNLHITDVDSGQLSSAKITLSGLEGADQIVSSYYTPGTTAGDTTLGIHYSLGTDDDGNVVITLSGNASIANYETLISSITYASTSDNPSTTPRGVTIEVTDVDVHGNTNLPGSNSASLIVTAVNDAPVLDLNSADGASQTGYAVTYVENGKALNIMGTVAIVDPDNTTLKGATITLSNAQTGDVLGIASQFGIKVTNSGIVNGKITITLSGDASVASYEKVIQSITFKNTTDNPGSADRTVTVQVNDGQSEHNLSNVATTTVSVTAVNDAPVVDLNGPFFPGNNTVTLPYVENAAPVKLMPLLTLSDPDSPNLQSATVTIKDAQVGDKLVFDTTNSKITITSETVNGQLVYTLKGAATQAEYAAVLKSVAFVSEGEDPVGGNRAITVQVNDGEDSSNVATANVTVIPVNDAPTLDLDSNASGTGFTTAYTENDPAISISGSNVKIGDFDNTNMKGAVITLTNAKAGDVLAAADQFGIHATVIDTRLQNGKITVVLSGSADLASYQKMIQSITYSSTSENPDTTPRKITITVNDGEILNSQSNTTTTTINVTAVNDRPEVVLGNNTYTENHDAVSIANGLVIKDVDNSQLSGAVITLTHVQPEDLVGSSHDLGNGKTDLGIDYSVSGPDSNGTMTITLTGNASVANYQALIQSIQFAASGEDPTPGDRGVQISVTDTGLKGDNVGNETSVLANGTITVIAVNDAPHVSFSSVSYTENDKPIQLVKDLQITDIDSGELSGVTITLTGVEAKDLIVSEYYQGGTKGVTELGIAYQLSTDAKGNVVIELSGKSSIANYETLINSLTYQNSSDNPSTTPRGVTIVVTDADAHGTDNKAADHESQVTVIAVNDAPVLDLNGPAGGTASTTSFTENGSALKVMPYMTINDPDSPNLKGATVTFTNPQTDDNLYFASTNAKITVTSATVDGKLVFTLIGDATQAEYNDVLKSLRFINTSDDPSAVNRVVTVTVNDGVVDSAPAQAVIKVTPVNDAPVLDLDSSPAATGTGYSVSFTENGTGVSISSANVSIIDPDNGTLKGATITLTNAQEFDVLTATDKFGIHAVVSDTRTTDGKITVTLTGEATLEQYKAMIESVMYKNTSDDPSTIDRVITVQVDDGSSKFNLSNVATSTISVTAVNDAPVLDLNGPAGGTASTTSFTENGTALKVMPYMTINDPDSPNLKGATVTFTNPQTDDNLYFASSNAKITVTSATVDGKLVFTLTGDATQAEYNDVLKSLRFINTSDDPSAVNRVVTVTVNDGVVDSAPAQAVIKVIPVNDAPTVVAGAYGSGDEDAGKTTPAIAITLNGGDIDGHIDHFNLVDLGAHGKFYADADHTVLLDATSNIPASGNSATIYFVPDADWSGTNNFTYKAVDNGLAANGQNVLASPVVSGSVTVAPVTDTPSLTMDTDGFVRTIDFQGNTTAIGDWKAIPVSEFSNGQWHTDNTGGTVEIGKASVYGVTDPKAGNQIIELERNAGDASNLWTEFSAKAGQTYTVSVDYSPRAGALDNSVINVFWGTTLIGTLNSNQLGLKTYTFQVPVTADGTAHLEFKAADSNSTGGILDNISVTQNANTGLEDQPILLSAVHAASTDIDGSETLTLTLNGLPKGSVITDGTPGHTFTADANNASVDITNWNASTLKFQAPANFSGDVALTLIATAKDGAAAAVSTPLDFTVHVIAVADAPDLTVKTATGDEDTAIHLDIAPALVDTDGSETLSTVISGIPKGAVLTDGTTGHTFTAGADNSKVSVTGWDLSSLTITPAKDANGTIALTVTSTATESSNGSAASTSQTLTVNVTPVNDAPVIGHTGTGKEFGNTWNETLVGGNVHEAGKGPGQIARDFTLKDIDSTTLKSATVTLTNFKDGDILNVVKDAGLTYNVTETKDALGHVISQTITFGPGTAAQYQTAIASITFDSSSHNPVKDNRIINISIDDGGAVDNIASTTSTIRITTVNDVPTVHTDAVTFTEGDSATSVVSNLNLDDVDNTTLGKAVVNVTGMQTGELLTFTGTAPTGVTVTPTTVNGVVTGFTINGIATIEQYKALIESIKFSAPGDNPTAGTRGVEITVTDTGAKGNNVGTKDSVLTHGEITVVAVNDAPIFGHDRGYNDYGNTWNETLVGGDVTAPGKGPGQIAADITIKDPDNGTLASATVTLTNFHDGDILNVVDAAGLQYATTDIKDVDGKVTGKVITFGPGTAAQYETAIKSITFDNSTHNPNPENRNITISVSDGTAVSDTVSTIHITTVNDVPTVHTDAVTFTEGDSATSVVSNLDLDDVDNSTLSHAVVSVDVKANDVLSFTGTPPTGVTVTPIEVGGKVTGYTIDGVATIDQYKALIEAIKFNNTSDNPVAGDRSVTVTVTDSGANGDGVNGATSVIATGNINVIAVNDAPIIGHDGNGTDFGNTWNETLVGGDVTAPGKGPGLIARDFTLSDPDSTTLQSATVTLTNYKTGDLLAIGNPGNLSVTLTDIKDAQGNVTGKVITFGPGTAAQYQAAISSITFDSTSHDPVKENRIIDITIDDGSAEHSTSSTTSTIHITTVDDAPIVTAGNSLYTEDQTGSTQLVGSLSITDVDNSVAGKQLQSATVTLSNYDASHDKLGGSINVGGAVGTGTAGSPGVTGTVTVNGVTLDYTAVRNGTNLVVTLSGNADRADYESVIKAITYSNDNQALQDDTRNVTVTVTDTGNDSNNVNGVSSDPAQSTLTLKGVNDAPVALPDHFAAAPVASLQGNYYAYNDSGANKNGPNLGTIQQALDFIASHKADATFDATKINYGGSFGNNLGQTGNLDTFLGGDKTSLVYTAGTTQTTSTDAILELAGKVTMDAGTYKLKITSDDGYIVLIDGKQVASYNANQSPTERTTDFTLTTGGAHDIQIVYWDQGGQAQLKVEVASVNGNVVGPFSVLGTSGTATLGHDTLTTLEDQPLVIKATTLLTNDTDVDGDKLSISSLQGHDPKVASAVYDASGTKVVGSVIMDATGNVVFTPAKDVNGEVKFSYTVTDGHGGFDTTTVTVNVVAVNDAPVATNVTQSVAEDATTPNNAGQLTATDADAGDALTYAVTGTTSATSGAITGKAPTGFVLDANTGKWTIDTSSSVYQKLGVGQSISFDVAFTATDKAGAVSNPGHLSLTVTGTNDAPVATNSVQSVAEDASAPGNAGQLVATDIDTGDKLTYAVTGTTTSASGATTGNVPTGFVLDANTGKWTIDTSSSVYQKLGVGQSISFDVAFTATDKAGAVSNPGHLSLTVTGTNDAPVATNSVQSVAEDASAPGNAGQLVASDVDNGDKLTYAVTGTTTSASGATTGNVPTGFVLDANTGKWTIDTSSSVYQKLGVGQSITFDVAFTATDKAGAVSNPGHLSLTVTGTNDAPVAQASTGTGVEDTTTTGQLQATDVDNNDVLTYTVNDSAKPAGFSVDASGKWTLDASNPAYQHLAAGETTTLTVPFTVTDKSGATSTSNLTIVVTGTNDAPVATPDIPSTVVGTLQGNYYGYNDSGSNKDGPNLATIKQALDFIASHKADATFDAKTINYGGSFGDNLGQTGNLDTFLGTDKNSLVYTNGNAQTTTTDAIVELAGKVTMAAGNYSLKVTADDGYIVLIDGKQVAAVDANQSAATNVTNFSIATDGPHDIQIVYWDQGGYAQLKVEVATVSGNGTVGAYSVLGTSNTATLAHYTLTTLEDQPLVIKATTLLTNDTDVDGDKLSISLLQGHDPKVASAVYDASGTKVVGSVIMDATGNVIFTPAKDVNGEVKFSYTVTDGHGGFDTTTVTVNVVAVNDAPVATNVAQSVAEDATTPNNAGQLTASDVDAGDALTYAVTGTTTSASGATTGNVPTGFVLDANSGKWTIDTSSSVYQKLGVGQSISFDVAFTATDKAGAVSNPGHLSLTVTGTNDAPVATNSVQSVAEDAAAPNNAGQLVASDIDTGDTFTYALTGTTSSVSGAVTGKAPTGFVLDANTGKWTIDTSSEVYQKLGAGQSITFDVAFTATDKAGAVSNPGHLTLTITGTNDAPTVSAATGSDGSTSIVGNEDPNPLITVVLHGSDVDGTIASFKLASTAANGKFYSDAAGQNEVTADSVIKATDNTATLYFKPTADWSGSTSFTYKAVDSQGLSSTGTATGSITVRPVADTPVVDLTGAQVHSTGLVKDVWVGTLTGMGTGGNGADPATILKGFTTTTAATTHTTADSAAESSVVQGTGTKLSGLIYLEAGHTYNFTGSADDSLLITIGGNQVASATWGAGAAVSNVGSGFVPTVSGYYTLDIYHYNQAGPGNYSIGLSDKNNSTNVVTTVALDSAHVALYASVDDLKASGLNGVTFTENASVAGEGYYTAYALNHGTENNPIKLSGVTASFGDSTDGSETHTVTVTGAPAGSVLTDAAGHSVTIVSATTPVDVGALDLTSLVIKTPEYYSGTFNLHVTATATEATVPGVPAAVASASASKDIVVTVDAVNYVSTHGSAGTDTSPINGSSASDIMVGDVSDSVVKAGTSYNIAFILDSSSSMSNALATAKQQLKAVISKLADSAAGADAGTIKVLLVDFDTNVQKTWEFDLSNKTLALQKLDVALATINADGRTNYEDAFKTAANWFSDLGAQPTTTENRTYFITDGAPNEYQNTNYTIYDYKKSSTTDLTLDKALQSWKMGTAYVENGQTVISKTGYVTSYTENGNKAVNIGQLVAHSDGHGGQEYSFLAATSDGSSLAISEAKTGYDLLKALSPTIEAIGINTSASGKAISVDGAVLNQFDSDGHATTGLNADQLAAAVLGSHTPIAPGADTLNGGDGNDILFGDVINFGTAEGTAAIKAFAESKGVTIADDKALHHYITDNLSDVETLVNSSSTAGSTGGNDKLFGGNGNDILFGQGGDDILVGGKGDDIMFGGTGKNTFVWQQGDSGSDVVKDFNKGTSNSLDLSDLLQGENGNDVTDLTKYLQITNDGKDTTIQVSSTGQFTSATTAATAATTADVHIKVEGVTWSNSTISSLVQGADPTIKVDHH